MRALDSFMVSTQEHVTGEVRLHLEAGRCDAVGRRGPRSLYDHDLATYDAEDVVPPPGLGRFRAAVGSLGGDVVAPPRAG